MSWTFKLALALIIVTAASTAFIYDARAGGLVECNHCASPKDAAILSGTGLTVVIDFGNARLTAFNVEYDREMRKWRAIPTPIPPQIQQAFDRIIEATTDQLLQSQEAGARSGGGPVIVLHPDNPGSSNGIHFPEAYKGSNTFDIVDSATLRTRLGQHLATALSGANTGNQHWNNLALSIQQAALTWSALKGGGTITIIIQWRDGSRTVYKVTADNVAEAKYVKGESRDSTGNKVPDESIADPATAPTYAGAYYFDRPNDMERWIRSAQQYGVPVVGSGSSQRRMSCSWDGRTVTCMAR